MLLGCMGGGGGEQVLQLGALRRLIRHYNMLVHIHTYVNIWTFMHTKNGHFIVPSRFLVLRALWLSDLSRIGKPMRAQKFCKTISGEMIFMYRACECVLYELQTYICKYTQRAKVLRAGLLAWRNLFIFCRLQNKKKLLICTLSVLLGQWLIELFRENSLMKLECGLIPTYLISSSMFYAVYWLVITCCFHFV